MNSLHTLSPGVFKIHFNIILSSIVCSFLMVRSQVHAHTKQKVTLKFVSVFMFVDRKALNVSEYLSSLVCLFICEYTFERSIF
jgi:hypothetical protein